MKSFFSGWRGPQLQRRYLQSCAVVAIIPLLSACGAFGSKTPPPRCPEVLLLKHANSVTYFKPGLGRDITDVLATIAITDFRGECEYNRKRTSAKITLNVFSTCGAGPQIGENLQISAILLRSQNSIRRLREKAFSHCRQNFREIKHASIFIDEVRLEIPMPPRPKIDEYSIYMGIQLTPQQLEYNQSQANRTQRR